MFLAGLTGGIGAGKSTVAARFVQHGMELIDADTIAREVMLPGTKTWKKVVDHFGNGILDAEGFIDRPALGRIVFTDPDRRRLLNALTHPPVIDAIANRLELFQPFDGVVVCDVPLLVEAGVDRGYEAIVVVATRPETQIARLVEQRRMSEADARARVEAQAPLDDKLAVATHVIWNEGSLDDVLSETDRVADDLSARAKEKAAAEDASVPDD